MVQRFSDLKCPKKQFWMRSKDKIRRYYATCQEPGFNLTLICGLNTFIGTANLNSSNMKTYILHLISIFLIGVLLNACSGEEKPMVGISMGPTHERWTKDIMYLTQHLENQGAGVIVQNAKGSETEQARQAQEMIDKEDLDVLIIVPVNSESAGIIVDYAKAFDVKVIAYDRIIKNCDLDCYLSFDNVRIGEMMAEYLTRIKPKGNYGILGGAKEDNNSAQLRIGQMNVLQPLIIRGDIKIVFDRNIEGWDSDNAYQALKEFLEGGGKLDAVISSSDELSRGAAKALAEYGLGKEVLLSGQDAQTDACQRIVQGTQTMTVYKVIESLATSTARITMALAHDDEIPNTLTTVNNGTNMIPSILLSSIIPVGEENIRMTVIADGFLDESTVFGE
jgi:D-xylose transport system substrate-binding protein